MARPTKIGLAVRIKEMDAAGAVSYPRYEVTFKNGRPYRCRRTAGDAAIAIPGDASFYITHPKNATGERVTAVGSGVDQAFAKYQAFAENAERQKRGLAIVREFVTHATDEANRVPIASAAERYIIGLEAGNRAKTTIAAYRKAFNDFKTSCAKEYIDELAAEDLMNFVAWMKKNLERRSVGQQAITFRKQLGFVNTLLIRNGKEKLWPKTNWPKFVKTKPKKYGDGVLAQILKTARPEEKIRIEFFIFTGCRDMEVAHAEYGDIDVKKGVFHIRNKPHLNWKPKDSEERDVVLPKAFIEELMKRKGTKKNGLIFPNTVNKVDNNLIEFLQKAAKRAGITERVTQHMIRRTAGTKMAERFGVVNAQAFLGHADLATTAKYMAADDMTSPDRREKVEESLAELVK